MITATMVRTEERTEIRVDCGLGVQASDVVRFEALREWLASIQATGFPVSPSPQVAAATSVDAVLPYPYSGA